nr:unnamed protein product [Callosobruchus chinensis]
MSSRTLKMIQLVSEMRSEVTVAAGIQNQKEKRASPAVKENSITYLMRDSINQQPPSFLIPWETSTYLTSHDSCISLDEFPSNKIMETFNFAVTNECEPRESASNRSILSIENDLYLSESEEKDPFSSSDNSKDSDYTPEIKNQVRVRNLNKENIPHSSDSDDQNKSVKIKKNTRKKTEKSRKMEKK